MFVYFFYVTLSQVCARCLALFYLCQGILSSVFNFLLFFPVLAYTRIYIYIYIYILKTPAASTAGPFLSILPVSVNNLGEVWLENLGTILGSLGERLGYLGRAWRQVGTLLAAWWRKDGEDERRWAKIAILSRKGERPLLRYVGIGTNPEVH